MGLIARISFVIISMCPGCFTGVIAQERFRDEIEETLRIQIMRDAGWALKQQPETITAYPASRSSGTIHDFYSEADYWWPDSTNLSGPYVQRDGLTNPANFTAHRLVMIRLSKIIGALASAYILTDNQQYVRHAMKHLNAWFADEKTKMNPSLLFAQAIVRKVSGRGIGIIDTIHLMEVAQGARVMSQSASADKAIIRATKKWFSHYLQWLTTHPYGVEEMNAKNNHGTCWVMQAAAFANLTHNTSILDLCRERYRTILLPTQMAEDGSFPLELSRTKPYGYSLFNLDAMVMICQILSDTENNLWQFDVNSRSIKRGCEFLYPYINDKNDWPFAKDVMYWENWPVAHPSLLFGAVQFGNKEWFNTWQRMDHAPQTPEVIRNLPVRNPLIWLETKNRAR